MFILMSLATGLAFSAEPEPLDPERMEFGALPAFGYSTDNGLGLGLVWTLVRFDPDRTPYRWKLYGLQKANAKLEDGLTIPSYNMVLDLDTPGLFNDVLRLRSRVSAIRMRDTAYHGFGNQAAATEPWSDLDPGSAEYTEARLYHRYDRVYSDLGFTGRVRLYDDSDAESRRRLEALASIGVLYNQITPYAESLLSQELALTSSGTADGQTLAGLLHGVESHALVRAGTGLLWDTRDHEAVPLRGHTVGLYLTGAPGLQSELTYGQLKLDLRGYQALAGPWLSLAVRAQIDLIAGDAPLYVLDGSNDSFSIRGVRSRRYLGKIKTIEGVELRSQWVDFTALRQRFNLGGVVFADAGRVWTDYSPVFTVWGAAG